MERKTSLAARVKLLGTLSQPGDSQTADVQNAAAQPAEDAGQPGAMAVEPPAPPQPKRRLPQWLTAPPAAQELAGAAAPAAQEPPKPKVSIRARVAAAGATTGLTGTQADPTAAATAAAAAAAATAVPSGTATLAPGSTGLRSTSAAAGVAPDGPKISLATRLRMPHTYRTTVTAAAPAAAAGTTGAAGEAQALQTAARQEDPPLPQQTGPASRQLPASMAVDVAAAAAAAAVAVGDDSPQDPQAPHSQDSLWDSDPDAQQDQQAARQDTGVRKQQRRQQQQQQQQEPVAELTLQQRQARQMAQLGLKLPGAGAGDEDGWLADVFASAAGTSGGNKRHSKRAAGGSGGRSGSGVGSAADGSGGSRGRGATAGAAGGGGAAGASGGRGRSGGGRGSGGPTGRAAASAVPLYSGAEDPAAAAAAAAAAGVGAAGVVGSEAVNPEPLVLYDADSNLRLQVPGSINQHLRSYQRQGVQFLFNRYAAGSGGVLCDDMGLGKTVQAISFIAALLGKQGTAQDALPRSFAAFRRQRQHQRQQRRQLCAQDGGSKSDDSGGSGDEEGGGPVEDAGSSIRWPVLVVCPTSVLDNWMRELNMWGTFKAIKYHGPPAARAAIADEASGGQYEVILTSYDTLRVDTAALADLHPHAVIYDEAHKLKNSKSKQYEAALALPTKYRYGLSGTIMQNDWDELYAVLDLLCPNCLGEYGGFVEYYSKPIKRGQSSTASNYEKVKGEKRLRQLVDVVKEVTLRRSKAIIADQLPRKTDNVVFCQLQPLQYRAYDRTLASPDLQALRLAKSPCDCGSGLKSAECCHDMVPVADGGVLWPHYHCCDCRVEGCKRHRPLGCKEYYESQGYNNPRLSCPYCLMLPALSLLTKISNHLELIRPDAKLQQQDERQFEFELAVARMVLGPDAEVLGGLLANSSGWLGASDETHCGKMATLKLLLQTWASDYSSHNKVLLFSHSTRCLDLLEAFVQRQGWDYTRLDGSTPQKLRQGICDEFNTRPSIFLLLMSTVAGGLGLNLTAANKVVVFDPSWNPAHDLQAQDRAYRLGQTRDVAVYRLVGTGTLEEAVYKRQIYKQQQSNMVIDGAQEPRYWEGVQGDTGKPGELWGLWNLLRFSGQTVETRDILQAYKGRHRQQIEQQLQDDARRQQQQQRGGDASTVPSADAGAAGAAAGAPAAKPFKIIVVDQLVASADEDAGPEGMFLEGAEAGGQHSPAANRKRRSSEDSVAAAGAEPAEDQGGERAAAGLTSAAAAAAGSDVGGIAAGDEAWCDEAVLEGLLDELVPKDAARQQRQQVTKRQRRRTILSDSDGEEEGRKGQRSTAEDLQQQQLAGQGLVLPTGLSPVAEGASEGEHDLQDSLNGEESDGPSVSMESAGVSACSADGILQPVVAADPVLAVLEEQGAILHVHRHEKVLGKVRKSRSEKQGDLQAHTQHHTLSKHTTPRQQQTTNQRLALTSPSSLVRSSVAEAYSQCSQADAEAADAAALQGWGPVASLAVWQGVSVVEMAQWLLQLTAEQRQEVLGMYAEDAA